VINIVAPLADALIKQEREIYVNPTKLNVTILLIQNAKTGIILCKVTFAIFLVAEITRASAVYLM